MRAISPATTPGVDVVVVDPTPLPFPTPIVNVTVLPDPSAMVGSAAEWVAAVATIFAAGLATWLAWTIDKRDRRERERRGQIQTDDRDRAARGAIGAAMLSFLETTITAPRGDVLRGLPALQQVTRPSHLDVTPMEAWLTKSSYTVRSWREHAYPQGFLKRPRSVRAVTTYIAVSDAVQNTIRDWMTTGDVELPDVTVLPTDG